ncbi:MAG TPA: phosphoribosylamine--glycine ligase [Chitinophagaceae bacterium]|nr:phosphoribosylamine--glycine ligase [Chitinophagaceae bacterium]MCC6635399.1 phosphoribosylamine--glycine ligase [Chitinophagaceae bacterium]HNF30495.1 phosphoribosylamine--glycine ligase [Chitinophagaceae bacterium]HNJ57803.1 phosphoribosylamine--glycine ligase [Chitinophagaceae bacterium]HNM34068.1 phosphoribosylamine--glycine ligase [Chitinophagaceae bacterium]
MNILLLGSGGRENALAWKMKQSHHCNNLFIAPGNAGTNLIGINVSIDVNDFESQKQFCIEKNIDIVVVGPEEPLVNGVFDYYKKDELLQHIIVVGPSAKAAQLEGSKAFSKQFMQTYKIPTATYAEFSVSEIEEAKKYIQQHSLPIVVKADGLAAGKGVIICETTEHAISVVEDMLIHKQFGKASDKVVVEEFLNGIELSVFALTNGKDYKIIGHAKDYKRVGEGDTGLNTGGMGCVSPVAFADEIFLQKVEETIIKPTISGLEKEELIYNGFVFFGLMNCNGTPYVIEYNCRLGDPETEVILPRLETDLVSLFAAMGNNTLADANIEFFEESFATIMAVSGGYPSTYKTNYIIHNLNNLKTEKDILIFHAGTKQNENGEIVTNGGRVLAVTAKGSSIKNAVEKSIHVLNSISFEGMYFRRDIGYEFK